MRLAKYTPSWRKETISKLRDKNKMDCERPDGHGPLPKGLVGLGWSIATAQPQDLMEMIRGIQTVPYPCFSKDLVFSK